MRHGGLAAVAVLAAVFLMPRGGDRRTDQEFVRGVALGLFATDPEWDYGPMVRELAGRGATDVLLVVHLSQRDRFASDLAMREGEAPSEATLVRTMRQARAEGLRVALMPIVYLRTRGPGDWRGTLTPADGLDAWFSRYTELLVSLATLAEREGVHRFVLGSELSSLELYSSRWRALAGTVRTHFSGTLTYSVNWDRLEAVTFWDVVDEIGLAGYYPLAENDRMPDPSQLARAWEGPRADIASLGRHGKPVLLLELGYPSRRGAARHPWDDGGRGEADLEAQRALYAGFCDAFASRGAIDGFYAWNWFGFGGPSDTGFSLRGKPAAAELETCFARSWQPSERPRHVLTTERNAGYESGAQSEVEMER